MIYRVWNDIEERPDNPETIEASNPRIAAKDFAVEEFESGTNAFGEVLVAVEDSTGEVLVYSVAQQIEYSAIIDNERTTSLREEMKRAEVEAGIASIEAGGRIHHDDAMERLKAKCDRCGSVAVAHVLPDDRCKP